MMLYKRQERAQKSNIFFPNLALIGETATVLDLLSEGTLTQFQVIARASSEADLEVLVKAVREILGDRRIAYSVETVGAPVCWFNRLPAAPSRKALQPGTRLFRPLVLREENIAALWPLHHAATGLPTSPFGAQPVRLFQTLTGQAYSFQFHIRDKPQSRGNYLLFAPTGGGKSTLMLHLLGGLAKFQGVRSYIFDSKEGARFMVEALGGVYQGYDSLALNPLDVGPDTPGARNRVAMILRALCGDLVLTPEDKEALGHAVDLAFQLEPPHRTLNEIFSHAFPRRSDLRRHMAQWVTDDKGKVRLREWMVTVIELPRGEEIDAVDIGDAKGFQVSKRGPRRLALRPIGAGYDSNLVVYGKSGVVYPIYLRTEGFNSENAPDLLVRINGAVAMPGQRHLALVALGDSGRPPVTAGPPAAEVPAMAEAVRGLTETDPLTPAPLTPNNDFVADAVFDPATLRGWGEYELWGSDDSLKPETVFRDDHFTYLRFGERWKDIELPTAPGGSHLI